jgi:hypothetical protein
VRAALKAVLLICVAFPLTAASDKCNGAWSVLNRVKEELAPDPSSGNTAEDKRTLSTFVASLQDATNNCSSIPELWYYRALVEDRLGMKSAYARSKAAGFTPQFNSPEQPPAQQTRASGTLLKKWALVVGIDKFSDPHLPALHYASKDARDLARSLVDPNVGRFNSDRVKQLLDEQATLQGIREGLGWLRASVQPDDLVLIYFSSHGTPRDADPNGVSYIMTHDTDLSGPASLYATSLQMIDLVQMVNRDLKASRVVILLDTCYSGDATGTRGVKPVWVHEPSADAPASISFSSALKIAPGRAVITASRANEVSRESQALMNGFFTAYLIQALQTTKGLLTLGDLFTQTRDHVTKEVPGQTPTSIFGGVSNTFVIGAPEGSTL